MRHSLEKRTYAMNEDFIKAGARTPEARAEVCNMLFGTHDDSSPLSKLRGNALVLATIVHHLDVAWYPSYVERRQDGGGSFLRSGSLDYASKLITRRTWPDFAPVEELFPDPCSSGDVNMMPIDLLRLDSSLPAHLKQWRGLIQACPVVPCYSSPKTANKHIAYLTVQEGHVPAGSTQRRPGIHIERPLPLGRGRAVREPSAMLRHRDELPEDERAFVDIRWGAGLCAATYSGRGRLPLDGIYTASSVSGSCAVWPSLVREPYSVTDKHGGVEHLRPFLGEPTLLGAKELCWMTDVTPHESLPLSASTFRQFFRLVVGPVSVWHARYNTPNPTGTLPAAPVVTPSDYDKFTG